MNNQYQEKNFNYQYDFMQGQIQSNDNQFNEENQSQEEKQIEDLSQNQEEESQLKRDQKSVEKVKKKNRIGSKKSEKKIQYYSTTQNEQKSIIDACRKYFEQKQSLSKNQISIIARRIVGKQIFKASHNWVSRLLFRTPQLSNYVRGIKPSHKKKQEVINQKPQVIKQEIHEKDNFQQYFWNQQEILSNIKKAFRERSNK